MHHNTPNVEWRGDHRVAVGDEEFLLNRYAMPVDFDGWDMAKHPLMIERYARMCHDLPAERIVELGVFRGGSTAFFASLPTTTQIAAFELDPPADSPLLAWIDERGLGDRVHAFYGVDQSDRATLTAALDGIGMAEIDMVIDDASHLYDPTLASFNCLFPRLRPGGLFVIEDWRWAHVRDIDLGEGFRPGDTTAFTRLVFELTMVCASDESVVSGLTIDNRLVVVERGPADLDPAGFDLADHYDDVSAGLLGGW